MVTHCYLVAMLYYLVAMLLSCGQINFVMARNYFLVLTHLLSRVHALYHVTLHNYFMAMLQPSRGHALLSGDYVIILWTH